MPDILSAPGVFRVQVPLKITVLWQWPRWFCFGDIDDAHQDDYGDKDDDNIDPSGIQLDSALQLDYGI